MYIPRLLAPYRWGRLFPVALGLWVALGPGLVALRSHEWQDAAARDGLIFYSSFESGDLSGFYWHMNQPEVVKDSHPVRAGLYSMRSYLHRYESGYPYRTEVIVGLSPTHLPGMRDPLVMDIGEEYWIGFSTYIPADFVPDVDRMSDILFQMQATPDPEEIYRSPVFNLLVDGRSWKITSRWDERPLSPPVNEFTGSATLYDAPLAESVGDWTDWVVHIRWAWQEDGFTRVWRNGVRVVDATGPNCSNDERGPIVALGLYKWPWGDDRYEHNSPWRLFYHDELRIADGRGYYDLVAPGQPPPELSLSEELEAARERLYWTLRQWLRELLETHAR